jgi:hypothetical protein
MTPDSNFGLEKQELASSRFDLDVIGAVEGSDKSSSHGMSWDYLRHFDFLFSEFRHKPINLVEVGVKGGASIRLWKYYFTAAHIVGIDINPVCAEMKEDRVSIKIGSQADPEFLNSVCDAYPPTLFIDDGSHLAHHNIFTFEHVFPLLLPGGIYIVEDLAFHFGPRAGDWQGPEKRNSPEYFLDLARSCMARRPTPGAETVAPNLVDMVDSVAFIGSAAIIRKRYATRGVSSAVALAKTYMAERTADADKLTNLAHYILKHDGNLKEADLACQAGMKLDPNALELRMLRADILFRDGRKAEAIDLLTRAKPRLHENKPLLHRLAVMQAKFGLTDAAIETLQGILARAPDRAGARKLLERLQNQL